MLTPPYLEALYESGYVLRQDDVDRSPFDRDKNVFHAIKEHRPCEIHGPLVKLALHCPVNTLTIDWTVLPDNARPIWFKHMQLEQVVGVEDGTVLEERLGVAGVDFGYQFNEPDGTNVQLVRKIHWLADGQEVITEAD